MQGIKKLVPILPPEIGANKLKSYKMFDTEIIIVQEPPLKSSFDNLVLPLSERFIFDASVLELPAETKDKGRDQIQRLVIDSFKEKLIEKQGIAEYCLEGIYVDQMIRGITKIIFVRLPNCQNFAKDFLAEILLGAIKLATELRYEYIVFPRLHKGLPFCGNSNAQIAEVTASTLCFKFNRQPELQEFVLQKIYFVSAEAGYLKDLIASFDQHLGVKSDVKVEELNEDEAKKGQKEEVPLTRKQMKEMGGGNDLFVFNGKSPDAKAQDQADKKSFLDKLNPFS